MNFKADLLKEITLKMKKCHFEKILKNKFKMQLMEMELGVLKIKISRILTEKLGLREVNTKFFAHQLTDDEILF